MAERKCRTADLLFAAQPDTEQTTMQCVRTQRERSGVFDVSKRNRPIMRTVSLYGTADRYRA